MPTTYTPTDEEASTLLDGVEGEADAGRKAQMVELLGNYRTAKQEAGVEPFTAGATIARDKREALNGLFGGLDQVDGKLPAEARAGFAAAVEASADRNDAKARMVNQAWVAGSYPHLASSVDADWGATKLHVAKELWGDDATDLPDTAFYTKIGAHLTKQQAEQEMLAGVLEKIQVEAAKGTPGDWLAAWKKAAKGISQDKAWNRANHDRYRALAQKTWADTQEKIEPLRVAITVGQKYYHLAVNPAPNSELLGQARQAFEDELMRLPKDQRETALQFAVAGAVDAAPKGMAAEGDAGFKEKLLESTKRAVSAFLPAAGRFVLSGASSLAEMTLQARNAYYGEADTPQERVYYEQQFQQRLELGRKITTGLLTAVDPIKSKSKIIQGLYDTPQSLVYMTAAGLQPELGIPLALAAMAEDNRAHFIDNGVPAAEAAVLAFAAAVPQVGIERLQANLLFKGQLPGFEKYLSKAVGSKLELARKMVVVGGLTTVAENAEEALQDITIPIYQEMGATLSEAVPDVKWTGQNGELAAFAGERVDTFFALLPLVLVGTGTASFKEAGYGRQYLQNKTLLKAAGFTEVAAEQISQTAVTDVAAAQDLVQTGWTNPEVRPAATKEKESADAKADLAAVGKFNNEEQQRAFDELDEQMKASWREQADPQGARAVRQDDGTFVVIDSTGALVDRANSPEEAVALVQETDRAEVANLDTIVDDMIAYFKERGRGGPIEKTGDIATLQDEVEAGRMTQEQAENIVKLYVEMGAIPADTQPDTARVMASNERVYNARKKIYEYLTRLHAGANPLDLVEDESEGYMKGVLDTGEVTIEDIEKWRQAIEGKLPAYGDENLRRRAAIEFFSTYAKAYLTAKIQKENTAVIPLSVRRWLAKMKKLFAQIFVLAKNLNDLDDAGKLPAGFKKHLARAVGLDEAFLDRRAREEERAEAAATQGPELLEWVKGKLPHPGEYTGTMAGELRDIYENLTQEVKVEARGVDQLAKGGKIKRARKGYKQVNKSTANAFFAKPGVEVDLERVVQAAQEMGYDVADVNDLLVAVDNSFRGNLSYSNPREDTQVKPGDEGEQRRAASVGAGTRTFALKPKPDRSRDMFDEGLADEDFALTGGTAEDASGAVDREEARREAKKAADAAQGEMTLEERADAYVAAVGVPEAKRDEATFALKKLLAVAEDTQLELGGDYQPRTKEQQRLDELHDQAQAELGMSPQREAQADVLTGDRGGIEASVETWKAAFGKDDRISAIIPALVRDPMKKWDIRGAIIKTPKDAAVLMQVLRNPYMETMKFIFLDGKNRVIHSEIGTIGTTTSSLAAPNVIARMLDRAGKGLSVRRVVIAHNHPSGDPNPSAADVSVTRQLNDAVKSVGFELVDHVVTNGETYYSFAEQGLVSGTYTAKGGPMGKAKAVGEDAQGGGLPSPVLGQAQPWEAVKMANLRVVNRPELAASMLNVLKQVDPTALHVFYLNRKNRMLGLERITNYSPADDQTTPAVMDPIELNRRIFEGIGRNGATAFIVALPDGVAGGEAVRVMRQLREFSKAIDIDVQDVLSNKAWGDQPSARAAGVLESAGRAPVETDPAKIAADRAAFDRLQAEMKTKAPLSPEYNALWQQSEDIKNRHGGFVPGTGDTTFSVAPAFYSRLTRTVEQSDLAKASGAQWKATIRNSKLGVNRDEFDLVSVGDLEDGKTYSKQEVLDYLRANEVKVEDVTLGEGEDEAKKLNDDMTMKMAVDLPQKAMAAGMSQLDAANLPARLADGRTWVGALPESIQADAEKFLRAHEDWTANNNKPAPLPTHFSQYVLPGAVEGSYREVLLTVPNDAREENTEKALIAARKEASAVLKKYDYLGFDSGGEALRAVLDHPDWASRWDVQDAADVATLNAFRNVKDTKESTSWRDGHSQYSDIKNPIVRLRTNERQTADGKRMLFLEEVQAPQKAQFEKMPALFQKNWREIAFKWALRRAAEDRGSPAFAVATAPKSIREEVEHHLGRELAAVIPLEVMDAAVLSAMKNDEVRRAVIEAIPVNVVDILTSHGLTPEQVASEPDMVGKALPVDSRAPVARGLANALSLVGTRLRATFNRELSGEAARGDNELHPAVSARDFSPDVIVGVLAPTRVYGSDELRRGMALAGSGGTEAGAKLSVSSSYHAGPGLEPSSAKLAELLNRHEAMKTGRMDDANKYSPPIEVLGFTTGAQQAERYDLSKHLDMVRIGPARDYEPDQKIYHVAGYKNGSMVMNQGDIHEQQLSDYVGKDLAAKASQDNAHAATKEYSGLDLKVGGEGLKKLYDQDFRNVVNGLPAVKRTGQKVGTATIPQPAGYQVSQENQMGRMKPGSWIVRDEGGQFLYGAPTKGEVTAWAERQGMKNYTVVENDKYAGAVPVHSLALTPAIRDSVMGGQATFSLAAAPGSAAFKAWFRDSKVVDAAGEPLVVYHGTGARFKKFNKKKTTQGIIWFTSDKEKIEAGEVGASGKGRIMELFASIQKPAGWAEYDKLGLYEFKGHGLDGAILPDGEGGFDGFVFESAQLKSATDNVGTFDRENPDITFSLRRDVSPEDEAAYQKIAESRDRREAHRFIAKVAGFSPQSSEIERGGAHSPADPDSGAPAWDLAGAEVYPADVYGANGRRYYGTGNDRMDQFAWSKLMDLEGKPTRLVKVYRAVEKESADRGIQAGSWVTIVRAYAVEHGQSALGDNYRIQEKEVHADEIYTSGDSWLEWGYHPQKRSEVPWSDSRLRRGPDGPVIPLAAKLRRFGDSSFSIGPMDQPERVRQAMRPRMIAVRVKASEMFADEVKAMVGLPKYAVRGMDVNADEARKIITKHEGDYGKLIALLAEPTQTMHPATRVALGFFVAEAANATKDYATAAAVAKLTAEQAVAAGQGVNEFKRWSVFTQPETCQQLLQTELEKENNRRKEREPAINAVVTVYADVQKEARKLLRKWIDEINGVTAENRKPVDVSSLPEVTFSLSAEQRATGIVKVVAKMLKESGADAVEAALLAKYGEKVEPHLADIFIEAQRSLMPRAAREGKKFKTRQPALSDERIEQTLAGQRGKQEAQADLTLDQMKAKGMTDEEITAAMDAQRGRQGEQLGLGAEGAARPGMSEAEIDEAMAEARALGGKGEAQASLTDLPGFDNRLIDEMMQRLGAANVTVPRGIRDQITELLNLRGLAASEDDVKRIIGAGRLLPNMTPAQAEELAGYAKRIASTPLDSFERSMQTMELFSYVHDQLAPYDLVDVAFGLWYANVLSSLITSARNITGNAGLLFMDTAAETIFRNPATYWDFLNVLAEGAQAGAETAIPAAKNAMVRGQEGLQRTQSLDDERRQGVLESKRAPLEGVRRISRLATRFLAMQDLLFANTAYEMKARQMAWDQAVKDAKAGKIKETEITKQVIRALNESTEQIQAHTDRAEKEWGNLHPDVQAGYEKANWVRRRLAELRLFERDHELVARSLDFAQKATLDYQPEGVLGVIMSSMSRIFAVAEHAAQDVQNKPVRLMAKAAAKYGRTRVIPFMRVPVNVFNRVLDYGPVGYGRALMDAAGIPILLATGKTKTRTADDRADLLKRATLGTVALLPLAILCRPGGDDDEDEPWLQIHGAGSGKPSTNLAQNGPKWRPYSLEINTAGKRLFIDYRMSPLSPYLAAIGALHDRTRYGKDISDKSMLAQGWILAQAMKEAFMSSSPITSLRELSEAAAENQPMSERSINRTLARGTAGVVANIGIPLAGLWRSLDQLAGGERNTRDTLLAASIAEIPVASRLNAPSLDALGDPLTARTGIGWLADWQKMETPEARIYLAFAQKGVSPTDISRYQSKMTPEDFYAFAKLRGQYLKDALLDADDDGNTGLQVLLELSDKAATEGDDSPAKKFLSRLSTNATRRALFETGEDAGDDGEGD